MMIESWKPIGPWSLEQAGPEHKPFLRRMLHEAVYVHEGEDPFPESMVDEPELRRYVADFGERIGDMGLVALDGGRLVGACWLRVFPADEPGYGWVADEVPELTIAVTEEARRQGLGTTLVEAVLQMARTRGVDRVSLSVDSRSPARRLYERLGFEPVGWDGTSMTMLRSLVGG
jgi:GNAT superfamily N-acetyltransferase